MVKYNVSLQASRTNNSSTPSVYVDLGAKIFRVTVRALVEIPAEEVITISYFLQYYSGDLCQSDLARNVSGCHYDIC